MKDSKVIPDPSLLNSRLCSRLGLEKTTQCPELAWPSVDGVFHRCQQSAWVQGLWGTLRETAPATPPPECCWKALRVENQVQHHAPQTWGGLCSSAPSEPSLQSFI